MVLCYGNLFGAMAHALKIMPKYNFNLTTYIENGLTSLFLNPLVTTRSYHCVFFTYFQIDVALVSFVINEFYQFLTVVHIDGFLCVLYEPVTVHLYRATAVPM
jgi:hypothetical protein